jgi:hypothetical protein
LAGRDVVVVLFYLFELGLQLCPAFGHEVCEFVEEVFLLFLIEQRELVDDFAEVVEQGGVGEFIGGFYLSAVVADFEELCGVVCGEEEGLSDEHVEQVGVGEAGHGGGFDVCFYFREGIAVVLHAVGQNLSDLSHDW